MAQQLISTFELPVLKIRLDLAGRAAHVDFELEVNDNTERRALAQWTCSAEEIGIPARLERGQSRAQQPTFWMPDAIAQGIQTEIEIHCPGEPLWLHLVMPIGYLALVPWEELLQPRLGIPILRVPDFLSNPPHQSPHRLDVAICCSQPPSPDDAGLIEYLGVVCRAILQIPTHRTRHIHIFTDARLTSDLRQFLSDHELGEDRVTVYDPHDAPEPTTTSRKANTLDAPNTESLWLTWMRTALDQRTVDVVHYVVNGTITNGQGALAFTLSPIESAESGVAQFLNASVLAHFMTRIGAWSAFFTSLPNNRSPWGLRLLADAVAQSRPGPLVHHDVQTDPGNTGLAATYHFLFGNGPPPASPAVGVYCHPAYLESAEDPTTKKRGLTDETAQVSVFKAAPELEASPEQDPPAWVSAAERYLEQRMRDIEQTKGARSSSTPNPEIEDSHRTLQLLRDLVVKAANPSPAGKKR